MFGERRGCGAVVLNSRATRPQKRVRAAPNGRLGGHFDLAIGAGQFSELAAIQRAASSSVSKSPTWYSWASVDITTVQVPVFLFFGRNSDLFVMPVTMRPRPTLFQPKNSPQSNGPTTRAQAEPAKSRWVRPPHWTASFMQTAFRLSPCGPLSPRSPIAYLVGYRHSCFNCMPNFLLASATNSSRSRASFERVGCSHGSVAWNFLSSHGCERKYRRV